MNAERGREFLLRVRRVGALRCGVGLLVVASPVGLWAQTASRPRTIPFTMTQTTTWMQTLANGLTITHVEVVRTIHDSEGRVRTEREYEGGTEEAVSQANGDVVLQRAGKRVTVNVNDPIDKVSMNWTESPTQPKLMTVRHSPSSQPPRGASRRPPVVDREGPKAKSHREDLGTKGIQGISARGWRTTTTYPADFDGNSAGYTVTSEQWSSIDLSGVLIERSDERPEGKSTMTLTSFQEGEPDPALFKTPEGYTVWDQDAKPAETATH